MHGFVLRKRIIHPDILFDIALIEELGERGLLCYILLWMLAEDWGGYDPSVIEDKSLPYLSGGLKLTEEQINSYQDKLIKLGKIMPYKVDGKTFYWIKALLERNQNKVSPQNKIPLPEWIGISESNYKTGSKQTYHIVSAKLPNGIYFRGAKKLGKTVVKDEFGEHNNVYMTGKEIETLEKKYGEKVVAEKLEDLSGYMESSGKSYKNHYATLGNWLRKDAREGAVIVRNKPKCSICGDMEYISIKNSICNKCDDNIKLKIEKDTEKPNEIPTI